MFVTVAQSPLAENNKAAVVNHRLSNQNTHIYLSELHLILETDATTVMILLN